MSEFNVYKKLLQIQHELEAPKNLHNSFGNYQYRSNEDILEAVKPILSAQKAIIIQSDEVVQIGNRNYVKATSTLFCIETGNKISNTAYACEAEVKKGMDSSQITGASSSYARKYSLNGLFAIDDSKDADATNKHGKESKTIEPEGTEGQKPPELPTLSKEKQWLNKGTKEFDVAKKSIADGKRTIAGVKKFYKLSTEVAELLKPKKEVQEPTQDEKMPWE